MLTSPSRDTAAGSPTVTPKRPNPANYSGIARPLKEKYPRMIVSSRGLRLFRCKGGMTTAQYFSRTLRKPHPDRGESYDRTNHESYPHIHRKPAACGVAEQSSHGGAAVR